MRKWDRSALDADGVANAVPAFGSGAGVDEDDLDVAGIAFQAAGAWLWRGCLVPVDLLTEAAREARS